MQLQQKSSQIINLKFLFVTKWLKSKFKKPPSYCICFGSIVFVLVLANYFNSLYEYNKRSLNFFLEQWGFWVLLSYESNFIVRLAVPFSFIIENVLDKILNINIWTFHLFKNNSSRENSVCYGAIFVYLIVILILIFFTEVNIWKTHFNSREPVSWHENTSCLWQIEP